MKSSAGKYIFILILAVVTGISGAFIRTLMTDLPSIRALYTYHPPSITRIYSSDNKLIDEIYAERRTPVEFEVFPKHLIQALISTEDRRFWKHSGIDLKGILRAAIKDIRARAFVEGASTLTQQLAKTLFLSPEKSLNRKLKEMFLAFQLERRFTKQEILELYLNQVYLGSGVYGVSAAADKFFRKAPADLTLDECALLAGLPKAPSYYSPLVHPKAAVERRNIVLNLMASQGFISKDELNAAISCPYTAPSPNAVTKDHPTAYFTDYVVNQLKPVTGHSALYQGGLSIHTTLNLEYQRIAADAVAHGLKRLKNRMSNAGLKNASAQAALIALEISSGNILAMVGGESHEKSPFNRSTMAMRQPGSAFKPILFAYALEHGFTQMSPILDAPVSFSIPGVKKDWEPLNYSHDYKGQITLRTALSLSKNIPAVRLIDQYGPAEIVLFAKKFGITAPLMPNLSLALGTSEMTLLDITRAYGVFPNAGQPIHINCILKIIKPDQTQIMLPSNSEAPGAAGIINPATAAIMCDMLQGVIQEGTGRSARLIKRPIGGKTGTTNDCRDALFIGFSPDIVAGVWVGNDDYTTLGKSETGARAALPIWIEFMKQALAKRPYRYFAIPDSVTVFSVNPKTGTAVPPYTPGALSVLFTKGTQPPEKK